MQQHIPIAPLMVSVADAIALSGVSHATVYRWIRSGRLPIRKAGRRTLIPTEALRSLLDELPGQMQEPPRRGRRVAA